MNQNEEIQEQLEQLDKLQKKILKQKVELEKVIDCTLDKKQEIIHKFNLKVAQYCSQIKDVLNRCQEADFIEKDFEEQYFKWDEATLEEVRWFIELKEDKNFPFSRKGYIYYKDCGEIEGFRVFQYQRGLFDQEPFPLIRIPISHYKTFNVLKINNLKLLFEKYINFPKVKSKKIKCFPQLEKELEILYINFSINQELIHSEIKNISILASQKSQTCIHKIVCQMALGLFGGIISFSITGALSIGILAGIASLASVAWMVLGGFVGFFLMTSLLTHLAYKINEHKFNKNINILKIEMEDLKQNHQNEKIKLRETLDPQGFKQKIHEHMSKFENLSEDLKKIQQNISDVQPPPLPLFNLNKYRASLEDSRKYAKSDEYIESEESKNMSSFLVKKF